MKRGNRSAIGYVRTAVADTAGEILNNQVKTIRQYCDKNELNLLKIFIDNGTSGLNFNREGWNELKEFVQHNKDKIQSLVVTNYDRISRDADKLLKETKMLEEDYDIKVSAATVPVHLENTVGKIQSVMAQKHKTKRRMKK